MRFLVTKVRDGSLWKLSLRLHLSQKLSFPVSLQVLPNSSLVEGVAKLGAQASEHKNYQQWKYKSS